MPPKKAHLLFQPSVTDDDAWFEESSKTLDEIKRIRDIVNPDTLKLTRLMLLESKLAEMKERFLWTNSLTEDDQYGLWPQAGEQCFKERLKKMSTSPFVTKDPKDIRSALKLTRMQEFLAEFFAPGTDKRSMLLFHDVGVGKTCTAISIAEKFADDNPSKKIMVLAPRSVVAQFEKQVFDPSNLHDADRMCTGNKYLKYVNPDDSNEVSVARIRQTVRKRYTFNSFHHILKIVDRFVSESTTADRAPDAIERAVDARIKKAFSDSLLIVDEVHNLRDSNGKDFKRKSEALFRVVRHATNMKLILLTATPLFNSAQEALWLINLMRANDKRPTIRKEMVFDSESSDDTMSTKGARVLAAAASGYVSRVKTVQDDANFPEVRESTLNVERFHSLALTSSIMVNPQASASDSAPGEVQVGNVFYPPDNKITDVFDVSRTGAHRSYKYVSGADRILAPELIGRYAAKMATIVREVGATTGNVFVHSYFIDHGLVPLAIALEHAGYRRYSGTPLLKGLGQGGGAEKVRGSYALFCGQSEADLTDTQTTMDMFNSPQNKDGSIIRIIIGSDVVSEGVDMKNVRQVHILEPWWHMNKIRQIVGRAARRLSHAQLEPQDRNVTVYLHAAHDDKHASPDLHRYKTSVEKGKAIDAVESVLTDVAITEDVISSRWKPGLRVSDAFLDRMDNSGWSIASYIYQLMDENMTFVTFDDAMKRLDHVFDPNVDKRDREKIVLRALSIKGFGQRRGVTFHPFRESGYIVREDRGSTTASMHTREREGTWVRPSTIQLKFVESDDDDDDGDKEGEEEEGATKGEVIGKMRALKLQTKDIVAACFLSPVLGEDIVTMLENEILDHIVDGLSHLQSMIILQSCVGTAVTHTGIGRSMRDAGYLVVVDGVNKYGVDVYDGVFYRRDDSGKNMIKVEPYEFATKLKPLLKGIVEAPPGGNRVLGFMDKVDGKFEFKITNVGGKGGRTRGTVCKNSLKNKDEMKQLLNDAFPSLAVADIDPKSPRQHLCLLYELLLRHSCNFERINWRS